MASTGPDLQTLRNTAAEHMLTEIPTAHVDTPVDKVIEALRGSVFECADTVFVTNATGQLQGIVRINDLFADGQLRIGDIMEPEHEAVRLDADQEEIAGLAIRLNMIAVPVVDRNERLIGAVPPEALFRILREEHMEDLQLIAGIAVHDDGPRAALDASVMNRIKRRLPWLIFGLVASSIITVVMVRFEHALAANVAVAFFVPALVYIAGAIGTQAVSVSVRSLARDDVQILQVLERVASDRIRDSHLA
jgi:magnesium transporter